MDIKDFKAMAYDILAKIQGLQLELQEINKKIMELSQEEKAK